MILGPITQIIQSFKVLSLILLIYAQKKILRCFFSIKKVSSKKCKQDRSTRTPYAESDAILGHQFGAVLGYMFLNVPEYCFMRIEWNVKSDKNLPIPSSET